MLDLPPPFDGRAVAEDPFEAAVIAAKEVCDAGLLLHRSSAALLEAALVLAPEVPLSEAAAMVLVAGNGFADAFGVLAPPEIALHVEWPGGFRVEGARCGGLRVAAPPCDDADVPGWLVIGLTVPVSRHAGIEPGERPAETDLRTEAAALPPDELLSAWARHTLSWIARWQDEGVAPVHRDWMGRAWGLGRPRAVTTLSKSGIFQGLDERGSILLKGEVGTEIVTLVEVLERR